ncbi:MAG: bifunctional hydroxymethylpyrimidine kinase/phosphomethylpyrimidine kinase [Actinobacteria bacterium]|nr:bifunctional hydroxymethylpyrimidine kinase/phosphomethylpyrimidine kinase [Actinomycetota bacterium]
MTLPVALSIAGVDSSGGAGVTADLATFGALGVWGTCAITAVTAQNSLGVDTIESMSADIVVAQIGAVCGDMDVRAVKTGMLGSPEMVQTVVDALPFGIPLVVDPVMVATTGAQLFSASNRATGTQFDAKNDWARLLARATIVTPNAYEAEAFTGFAVTDEDAMVRAARALLEHGCESVLVKGGHVGQRLARDCLILQGQAGPIWLESPRIDTADTHGTGCVLSAAIAARLALGHSIADACQRAKDVVTNAIRNRVSLGKGVGAVNPRGRLR